MIQQTQQKNNSKRVVFYANELNIQKSQNALVYNHKNDVADPNNVESEENSDDCSNNLTILNSCDDSANPRSDWDDCKNKTYDPRQSKVIRFFCHFASLLFFIFVI